MNLDLAIMRLADRLASYASVRQSVIAENIANADTPGFRARDLLPFADAYADAAHGIPEARPSRPGHFVIGKDGFAGFDVTEQAAPGAVSPNDNSVALEDQMMRSAELQLQHDLALGVYHKSLQILRAGLGRVR